jgi:hypothetical protein
VTPDAAESGLGDEADGEAREVVAGRAPGTPFLMLLAVGATILALVAIALAIVVVAGWAA